MPTPAGASRPSAEPITDVIAERVRLLRDKAGMSQADLAKEMTALGRRWSRATVVNLETKATGSRGKSAGRDVVTVGELLALALALKVSPDLLLADPRSSATVPVADGVDLDSWSALYWLMGLSRPTTAGYGFTDHFIREAILFESLINQVPPGLGPPGLDDSEGTRTREAFVRATLVQIQTALIAFGDDWKVPLPPLPPHVRLAARYYGVDLPGVEA